MRPLLNKWLDGVVKPLLTTAKKGGLGINELLVCCVKEDSANCESSSHPFDLVTINRL